MNRLGGYEQDLKQALKSASFDRIPIYNHGMNGAELTDVAHGGGRWNASSYSEHLARDQPTIVVLFVGTNDIREYPHIQYFEVRPL